ncbi:hypothetical protein [uncultured Ruegeria sp.]|uniref:hypothetical protein n=1 Tax=uncultured Ruegeria sp. TaxID=259304 RepID=UPI002616BC7C|nr:hypothetical protein [uncultured Ruegeria sp.]
MLRFLLSWLTSGPLDRVLDTVDQKFKSETDKEKIKGDLIQTYYRTRADWMQKGGFVLMLLFAAPLAYWFAAVCIYSVHWCADCADPKSWSIAALPPPLDEWAGLIVASIFGVIGVTVWSRGRR